jgi:hypothetical protein
MCSHEGHWWGSIPDVAKLWLESVAYGKNISQSLITNELNINNLLYGKRVAKCPCPLIQVCLRLPELLNVFRCSEVWPTLVCTQWQVTYLEYMCTPDTRQHTFKHFDKFSCWQQIISDKMPWHWSVIWSPRHELMWKNFTLANISYTVRKVSTQVAILQTKVCLSL